MCLGCAVYINNQNYEKALEKQDAQDYDTKSYGE